MTRTQLLRRDLQTAFPRTVFHVRRRKHPEWHLVHWERAGALSEPPGPDDVGSALERAGWRLWHPAPDGRGILVGWVNRTGRALVVAPAEPAGPAALAAGPSALDLSQAPPPVCPSSSTEPPQ